MSRWTPLHHAALAGNLFIIGFLCLYKAKKTQTDRGADYRDLWELTHSLSKDPQEKIHLLWQEGPEKVHQMTKGEFKQRTQTVANLGMKFL